MYNISMSSIEIFFIISMIFGLGILGLCELILCVFKDLDR